MMGDSAKEPPSIELPGGWVWGEFLRYMHWTDQEVLDRQEAWFVLQQKFFYGYKAEYGLLGS